MLWLPVDGRFYHSIECIELIIVLTVKSTVNYCFKTVNVSTLLYQCGICRGDSTPLAAIPTPHLRVEKVQGGWVSFNRLG